MEMSLKEITRRYKVMLTMYNYADPAQPDHINCYGCNDCGHMTKTIDVDSGQLPLSIPCEKCGENAMSSFYFDHVPSQKPTIEFYRPTLEQTFKKRTNKDFLHHVLMGGLEMRKI